MKKSELNFKTIWKPLAVVTAVVFLYAPVLMRLGEHWWTDENYSHGLLVPFIIAYIIWFKFDELKKAPRNPQILLGGLLVVGALIMLLGGTLGAELFVQRISFLLMLVGIVIYFFGERLYRMLMIPFILLLLAIPIPQIIFNKIAFPLQIYASQIAVWGIRLFGVPTVRKGNVIEILPEGAVQVIALEVVEACSGIRSLMTLMTLALILAYWTRRNYSDQTTERFSFITNADFWRGTVLMFSAIPIAILTNAGRVTATGVLTYFYGNKATEGFAHDAAGWVVYIVALILLIGLNAILKKVLKWKSEDIKFKTEDSEFRIQDSKIYLLIGVLLAGGLFINWFEQRGEAKVERRPLTELSGTLGEWRQKGGDIRFSEATESVLKTSDYMMREYVKDGRLANLYIGYYASQRSGATYHSPQNCLPGAGWEMKKPELIEITMPDGKTFEANRYIIENGQYKEVMIYWYQGRGRTIASEYHDKVYTVLDSVLRRRSDGAMVRVMTSVGSSEREATKEAVELAAQTADKLSAFVPE
jgi:exosortase D (VPLPA-CTERM-specific)